MNLELVHILEEVLFNEGLKNSSDSCSTDNRKYTCQVDTCNRRAYAKGLCNAHYLRHRKGQDLTVPVRGRKKSDKCIDCGDTTNAKGGWNRCTSCYRKRKGLVLKAAIVEYFGNKCSRCGNSFDLVVYDFHHKDDKNKLISHMFIDNSIIDLVLEVSKCILVCANCHRLIHEEIRNGEFR
jgi:hypothetical protein